MLRKFTAALALATVGIFAVGNSASALVSVSSNVTTDTVWGDDPGEDEILLEEPIFVTSGATLTILPGVIVRGQPRSGPVIQGSKVGSPGALIVTRDGFANIAGGSSNPIIMTTAAVDNDADGIADDLNANGFEDAYPGFDPAGCPGSCVPSANPVFFDDDPTGAPLAPLNAAGDGNVALWGGLVILGNAPTNLADKTEFAGYGEGIVEGLTVPGFPAADATYGGLEPHDSSGVFRYVSVRHAGDEIGTGNELNGVTLGAVGDGTIFENIEVYCNFDDGIEWFGGTVNGSKLIVVFAGDDTFDIDQGYTGTNEQLFGILPFFNENDGGAFGSVSGDRAGEWDGDDFLERGGDVNIRVSEDTTTLDDTGWPTSNPAMYNMTIIGATPVSSPDFTPVSSNGDKRGLYMRHGFAGEVLNSIVVNTGSRAGLELDMGTGESVIGRDVADNVAADLIRLVSSTLEDGAALAAGAAALAASNGDAAVPAQYNDSGTGNALPGSGFLGLGNEDVSFDPRGDASGKLAASLKSAKIDPLPDAGSPAATLGGGVNTGPKGLTFRGAFQQSTPLWTDGWTTLYLGGLL
jgi:hypothetical protein